MKVLKGLAITFVLSVTAACVGVQADDYMGLLGIKIPGFNGTYTSVTVKKTDYNNQFQKSINTVPRGVGVRAQVNNTNGDHGKYYTLNMGGCTKITGTDGVGTNPGNYKLNLQTTSFQFGSTEYTGTWVLDENLKNSSGIC